MPRTRRATKRKTSKRSSRFRCPDCGFLARHAMGLGRHRSARHGVVSKRAQMRRRTGSSWLTRNEAARRAKVHYNTVRQWERAGLLRTSRRPGARDTLVSAGDLAEVLARRATSGGADLGPLARDATVRALEQRYRALVASLERVLAEARAKPAMRGRPRKRR